MHVLGQEIQGEKMNYQKAESEFAKKIKIAVARFSD